MNIGPAWPFGPCFKNVSVSSQFNILLVLQNGLRPSNICFTCYPHVLVEVVRVESLSYLLLNCHLMESYHARSQGKVFLTSSSFIQQLKSNPNTTSKEEPNSHSLRIISIESGCICAQPLI